VKATKKSALLPDAVRDAFCSLAPTGIAGGYRQCDSGSYLSVRRNILHRRLNYESALNANSSERDEQTGRKLPQDLLPRAARP